MEKSFLTFGTGLELQGHFVAGPKSVEILNLPNKASPFVGKVSWCNYKTV